jgi:hypothetical protein
MSVSQQEIGDRMLTVSRVEWMDDNISARAEVGEVKIFEHVYPRVECVYSRGRSVMEGLCCPL